MTDKNGATDISVIIPTYNRAARLMQAINSVRQQTLLPLEIIVVDDASTDQTPGMLAGFNEASLRILRSNRRRGASHARNLGIAAATGSVLAFLDDDDSWLPDKLALQSSALGEASARVGMVCSAYNVISDHSGRVIRTWYPPAQPMDVRYFLRTTGFMTTVPLLRRECFEQVGGFDEDLSGGQDLDMWIRIAKRFEVAAVPQVLAEHYIHGEQITTDLLAKACASANILRKHRVLLDHYPELLHRQLHRAGLLHCAAKDFESGRAYLTEAIALEPGRVELSQHLERSLQDPLKHSAELITEAFRSVDGFTLFY